MCQYSEFARPVYCITHSQQSMLCWCYDKDNTNSAKWCNMGEK